MLTFSVLFILCANIGSLMEIRYKLMCLGFRPHNLPRELLDEATKKNVVRADGYSKKRKVSGDGGDDDNDDDTHNDDHHGEEGTTTTTTTSR